MKTYLNPKQMAFMATQKKVRAFVGGRGSGKSAVLGGYGYQCIRTMPRSRGALISDTEETIYNRSLPSILEWWEKIGLEEDQDYVIGKKPPSFFESPYNPVKKYNNVISFWNGVSIDLISLYGKNKGRGGNYQFILGDEFALVDKNTFETNVIPALRGNFNKIARIEVDDWIDVPFGQMIDHYGNPVWEIPFAENPYYNSIAIVTSMPWTSDGQYILDFEEDSDAFYVEATALDNRKAVGPDYMQRMKKILPDLIYQVEVENKRLGQIPDGFYPEFSDKHHTYRGDKYRTDLPLYISLDFNAGFNSMIVSQYYDNICYIIDELFVKGNRIVDDLIELFVNKYQSHGNKFVEIYGDRNGNNRQANSKTTIYESIEKALRTGGWNYYRPHKGLDAPHADKHQMINTGLKEEGTTRLPKIRIAKHCKHLIISINTAPMTHDFKKDKRSETRKSVQQEYATHLSDCLDNLYVFQFKHLYSFSALSGLDPYMG